MGIILPPNIAHNQSHHPQFSVIPLQRRKLSNVVDETFLGANTSKIPVSPQKREIRVFLSDSRSRIFTSWSVQGLEKAFFGVGKVGVWWYNLRAFGGRFRVNVRN